MNGFQPRVTVLMPVYNGEAYIREALESVLAQTFSDFELLIGDDASTDHTPDIVMGFSDARIRYVRGNRNRGQFGNLNSLLPRSRGSLVKFLCHDDALAPECLDEHVKFFEQHPQASMSMCQAVMIDQFGTPFGQCPSGGESVVFPHLIGLQLLLYHGCVPGNLSSVCVRREVFDRGGFDESYRLAGDYEMWVRVCTKGRLGDLQKVLFRERDHLGRVSYSPGAGVTFVQEKRRVRAALLVFIPQSVRPHARRFIRLRHNVLDTHQMITCLRHGRFGEAYEICQALGKDLLFGVPLWLLTLNNHLYIPKPRYQDSELVPQATP